MRLKPVKLDLLFGRRPEVTKNLYKLSKSIQDQGLWDLGGHAAAGIHCQSPVLYGTHPSSNSIQRYSLTAPSSLSEQGAAVSQQYDELTAGQVLGDL